MTGDLMRADDPMRRSGARWCETHERWECSKRSRTGACHGVAIRGKAACRIHAGVPTWLAKAQGEANLQAWTTEAAAAQSAAPLDTAKVVMDQLRVAVYRADLYGVMLREAMEAEQGGAFVGPTYAAGRDGARVETGEAVRALAKLEAEWRDRVVRFAKTAHDMGIDSKHIEIAQQQADVVVAAFVAALDVAGLAPGVRPLAVERFLERLGDLIPAGTGQVVSGEVEA